MSKPACNEGKPVGRGCIQSTLFEGPNSDKLEPSEFCAKSEIVRLALSEYVLILKVISKLIIGKLVVNLP